MLHLKNTGYGPGDTSELLAKARQLGTGLNCIIRDCRVATKYVEFDVSISKLVMDKLVYRLSPIAPTAWDEAKDALLRIFVLDGYPAARITSSTAEVDPESAQVQLRVSLDSGPLFRFGETRIEGLQRYPQSIVDNLRRFRSGERYNHEVLMQYQTDLQASGFFRSASVSIDTDPAQVAAAQVQVRLGKHPEKKIDLGVGFSTDTRARAEATYADYNTFRPGW